MWNGSKASKLARSVDNDDTFIERVRQYNRSQKSVDFTEPACPKSNVLVHCSSLLSVLVVHSCNNCIALHGRVVQLLLDIMLLLLLVVIMKAKIMVHTSVNNSLHKEED